MTPNSLFDCKDNSQINSLIKELWKKHPQYTETDIRRAIKECCDKLKDPILKEELIECVSSNIRWLNI
jgi:hypothetical protein